MLKFGLNMGLMNASFVPILGIPGHVIVNLDTKKQKIGIFGMKIY